VRTIQCADHERVRLALLGGFDQLDAQQVEAEETAREDPGDGKLRAWPLPSTRAPN
jgi:hypothetical protein